mgnify:FL=1
MKKTFLLSCLMLAAMPVMAAYTGHVYVDKNKMAYLTKVKNRWRASKYPMA